MSSREAYERLIPDQPNDIQEEAPPDAIACVLYDSLERGATHCYLNADDEPLKLAEDGPSGITIIPLRGNDE